MLGAQQLMMPTIHAQVGDVVEFSLGVDGVSAAVTQGRVMDVDPAASCRCSVQVSPFEPFRLVDFSKVPFKIIYAVGQLTRLTTAMIGWDIEIVVDEEAKATECGVIKHVDCDLNCALIAFVDGRKDWRDLTMNAFKVIGHPSSASRSSPSKSASTSPQHLAVADVPRAQIDMKAAVHAIQAPLPTLAALEFEWYTEGGHVELCDSDGRFQEGALLCSVRDKTMQLYNEKRQFFEIQMLKQYFKVIIHGLVTLKSVPLGQAVEVYSPMHGEFRRGLVLKTAEIGKLTPIRFEDIGLEWVDLTSQTFKLLFLASAATTSATDSTSEARISSNVRGNDAATPSATGDASPQRQNHKRHENKPLASSPPPLPVLSVGHVVELFDSATKQFIKYRVTRVHSPENPNTYDLELSPSSSSGSNLALSVARAAEAERLVTIDIANVKARVQLTVDDWERFEPNLRGYRVDVYDKADRSVLNGKIIDTNVDGADGPLICVKLKDGTKRWFVVKHTKVKVKLLPGEPTAKTKDPKPPKETPSASLDAMWQCVEPPVAEPVATVDERKAVNLPRQQSEKVFQEPQQMSQLARHASSPHISQSNFPSQVPSLDLCSVIREKSDPVLVPPMTTESMHVEAPSESQRSVDSNAEALSDLLPAMDDVWAEEPTQDGATTVMRYVHLGTGDIAHELPQWLKKTDEATGESFILNTVTGVRFQPPGSSISLSTTPHSSGRGAVVTLPIGPIEAARVVTKLALQVSSADLLAEAFGP